MELLPTFPTSEVDAPDDNIPATTAKHPYVDTPSPLPVSYTHLTLPTKA